MPSRARTTPSTTAVRLRVWASGTPVGVNHSQRGMGHHRAETPQAQAWGAAVAAAVQMASRQPDVRWTPRDLDARPLGVRLHFFVVGKPLSSGATRKLDVDAPVKLTLDRALGALGQDDTWVRSLSVAQTVLSEDKAWELGERLGRAGYGKTALGCWVEVWCLSRSEMRRLSLVKPGCLVATESEVPA